MLKRMNRHSTAAEYAKKCEILRKAFKNPAITTDVIVGFPQESEEEFQVTKEYLEKLSLYEMHIFKYSPRKGTVAAAMKGQVPEEIKTKRSQQLLLLTEELSKKYRQSMLSENVEVLWEDEEEIDGRKYITGYTKEYIRAAFPVGGNSPKSGDISRGVLKSFLRDDIVMLEFST